MSDVNLAKRAVACKGWRWMPGMRALLMVYPDRPPNRITRLRGDYEGGPGCPPDMARADAEPSDQWIPDLDDPATLGCLLALVREAWGDTGAFAKVTHTTTWTVEVIDDDGIRRTFDAPTEAAAIVAALEAAP